MFDAPVSTTINKKEPSRRLYVIGFAPELVDFILVHKKIKTYRLGKRYNYLKIGDEVSIQNSTTGHIVGSAVILDKEFKKFIDLHLKIDGHESYNDKEHQRTVFNGYYDFYGKSINDNDQFIVLDFKLIR